MANVVVSHPKCGRTWLRPGLGFVVCQKHNIDVKKALCKRSLRTVEPNFPDFTHDDCNKDVRFDCVVANKLKHVKDAVVFLTRNPFDVLVSHYYHCRFRRPKGSTFNGTISDFIRHSIWGADRLLAFYRLWASETDEPKHMLKFSYEDMHAEFVKWLRASLDHFGIEDIPSEVLMDAENFCQFQNMQHLEKSNFFDAKLLRANSPKNPDSYKVREGGVGTYVDHMSSDDIDYVKERIVQSGFALEVFA